MRVAKNIFYVLVLGLIITSCKKDDEVEMVSLNKAGDEYYFGEKVLMWASTEGEKEGMSYEWSANGGRFEGFRTQNLFENVWVAPTQVGQYQVTATAKKGKNTSTRTTTMNVTRYFFDHFQSPYTFIGNGWSQSNVRGGTTPVLFNSNNRQNSSIELASNRNNNSNTDANIRRLLNLAELKIPFSVRTKIGYKTFFKTGAPFTVRLLFNQPSRNPERAYIREIRWEIWPRNNPATQNNYQIRFETYTPATGTGTFTVGTFPAPYALTGPGLTAQSGRDPRFLFTDGVAKNITFSINAENVFIAHVEGVEWFRSDGIKNWLAEAKTRFPDFEDPVVREFQIQFPGKVAADTNPSILFLNSVYINNDGTILSDPI
ncbi:PKD domain-containing protein [Pedobacter glucosidilyticus]|uniref:PKD domain-containing protein n=1 Tax=Pedobacter glucosidilyticus TaxID=1122941 RepID=UPI00047D4224|nr:PKD domain-containing protein [Pedobacter glucosidilyticus]